MHATTTLAPDAPEPPWYRQGWPWAIIAIPATSVALGIMMIVLAVGSDDALVVDDWYKEGKTINRRIERDRAAVRFGLGARVTRAPDALVVELGAIDPGFDAPGALRLDWVHVTDAARDGGATLVGVGGGRYVAAGAELPADGRWRLHLSAAADGSTDPSGNADGGAGSDQDPDAWRLVGEAVTLDAGSAPTLGAEVPAAPAPR